MIPRCEGFTCLVGLVDARDDQSSLAGFPMLDVVEDVFHGLVGHGAALTTMVASDSHSLQVPDRAFEADLPAERGLNTWIPELSVRGARSQGFSVHAKE